MPKKPMGEPDGLLYRKMKKGYPNLTVFIKRTHCPVSYETARRCIYEEKPVSTMSFSLIAFSLGYKPGEIRRMLFAESGTFIKTDLEPGIIRERKLKNRENEYVSKIIKLLDITKKQGLTILERSLLSAVETIAQDKPSIYKELGNFLERMAQEVDINIEEQVNLMKNESDALKNS